MSLLTDISVRLVLALFVSSLVLICAHSTDALAGGRARAELFDGPDACLVGEPACPATGYSMFIDAPADVALGDRSRPGLVLLTRFSHASRTITLELEIDLQSGISRASLTEHDSAGALTFRSTRAVGVVQLHPATCRCADGRFDLLFESDVSGAGETSGPRLLRLSRGDFSSSSSFCRKATQMDLRQRESIALETLPCPPPPASRSEPTSPRRDEDIVDDTIDDVPIDIAVGWGPIYTLPEEQAEGCGGEPPPDDTYYDDAGCDGDSGDLDYEDTGCEGDDGYGDGGCEGDDSYSDSSGGCDGDDSGDYSGDCEGDAHAALASHAQPTKRARRGGRLRTLPLALLALALLRATRRRFGRRSILRKK